jgi:hypothetical protein
MASATEIGGDVVAAGSAVAGLMLVYMGSLSASFSTYSPTEKRTVQGSFSRRMWFACTGLLLNGASIPFGLAAKALDCVCALFVSLGFLMLGLCWLGAVAVLTAQEIK